MLIDDHGEGFPAAFCFSSRVNEATMTTFLTICRECIGHQMSEAVLMTDDAPAYCNAWTTVMGAPAHQLLCTWHVDRAWQKNLQKIKGDNVLKATVYKTLRSIVDVRDKDEFAAKLKQFMETALADSRLAQFAAYFEKEYANRPRLWALCHRLGLHAHHNMHLEAMHRVLKHVHMDGRKVKRMDKCIHALLRFMRSKMNDRLLKINKGKWTRHLLGIRRRHKKGIRCDASLIKIHTADRIYAVHGSKPDDVYMLSNAKPFLTLVFCVHFSVNHAASACIPLPAIVLTLVCVILYANTFIL